ARPQQQRSDGGARDGEGGSGRTGGAGHVLSFGWSVRADSGSCARVVSLDGRTQSARRYPSAVRRPTSTEVPGNALTCGDAVASHGVNASGHAERALSRDRLTYWERGHLQMTFTVGETVVYPHHGAALIEEVKTRKIRGEEKMYLKLKVAQGDLTIEVPAENVDLVGVRDVVDQEGLDRVFDVLRAPYTEEPTNWSRRYKANLEKLASGDVIKVGEVVRDLSRRDADRGLSAGEKRMLSKARQILVSELAL